MSNFNICKSNTVLIIVIVATSLTEVITLRQAEVLVNESAFIRCFSKEVKSIQWHHTPPGKQSNKYVYAGGKFYSPNAIRFRVDNDLTTNVYTLVITNVMHEDAGLYECKDDVLSGVFGSTYLSVLDSSPVCTSNMNPSGFAGPNTCNIKQENMTFSCAVSFSGNSPNLKWSTLNGNQASNSSICEIRDNRINCSLSMKADPSFDGSTFICQTTASNDARYNCSIEDIRVEYFFGDYEAAEKRLGDNVTCVVESNLQIHYNWTIQQNNQDNIFSTNQTISFQEPGFYKCSVKYNIRNVTCYATIVAVNVTNTVDFNVSVVKSNALAIGVSNAFSMCLGAVIAFLMCRKRNNVDKTSEYLECRLPLIASTTPGPKRPCYALKNFPRGYCIIINNFEFPKLKPRYGALAEIEALKKLLKGLKFKVDARKNLTAEQMTKCLKEYQDRDHSESDAFICCLLSHGEKGHIDATDGQIPVMTLMELFYDRNCPGLVGKPKLFFIGACQGRRVYEKMPSTSAQPNPSDSYGRLLPEGHCIQYGDVRELVPSNADFIVSYACLPETIAWHDSKEGGLYVQALCRQLSQGQEIDVALRNVSQEVRDLLNTYDKEGEIYSRQDPFHIIMPPHNHLFLGSA